MAFPLTPTVGDRHTESGLRYKWTGDSWDLVDVGVGQQLILSTVDPISGQDIGQPGTIWRNTTSGDAYRFEKNLAVVPSPIVVEVAYNNWQVFGFYAVQSLTLNPGSEIVSFTATHRMPAGTTVTMFAGVCSGHPVPDGTGPSVSVTSQLGGYIASDTVVAVNPDLTSSWGSVDLTFSFPGVPLPSLVTIELFYVGTPTPFGNYGGGWFASVADAYPGGQAFRQPSNVDLAFKLVTSRVSADDWVLVTADPKFVESAAAPSGNRIDGVGYKDGDLWYNSTNDVVSYYYSGSWDTLKAIYDNTIINNISSTYTQGALEELSSFLSVAEGGARFIGSYSPSTNFADFTPSSAYVDGVLPSANTLTSPDFLVVIEEAVGQAPAPAVQMYKGDYLIAYPATNTWVHLPIGSALGSVLTLPEMPNSYAGYANYTVAVDSSETSLEFIPKDDFQSFSNTLEPVSTSVGDQWFDPAAQIERVLVGPSTWVRHSYVQESAGIPPASPSSGQLWYNSSTSTLYIYDVSTVPASWVSL